MSRPKNWWYRLVQEALKNTDRLPEKSMQTVVFMNALELAKDDTRKLPNGDLRIKAVEDVLINRRKSVEEVAMEVHYSDIRVRQWLNEFVNLLGRKAGY